MEDTITPVEPVKRSDTDWVKASIVGVVTILLFCVAGFLIDRVIHHYWDGRSYGPILLGAIAVGLVGMHISLQYLVVKFLKIKGGFKQAIRGSLMVFVFNLLGGGALFFMYMFPAWLLAGMAVLALISAAVAVHIIRKIYGLYNAPSNFVAVDEIILAAILNYAIYSAYMWVMRA